MVQPRLTDALSNRKVYFFYELCNHWLRSDNLQQLSSPFFFFLTFTRVNFLKYLFPVLDSRLTLLRICGEFLFELEGSNL